MTFIIHIILILYINIILQKKYWAQYRDKNNNYFKEVKKMYNILFYNNIMTWQKYRTTG